MNGVDMNLSIYKVFSKETTMDHLSEYLGKSTRWSECAFLARKANSR